MPLNVRRYSTSTISLVLFLFSFSYSQTPTEPVAAKSQESVPALTPVKSPTSAEVMRDRITKAKAFIAVRNYHAAIYELENIRRETSDISVRSVTNVLLMNCFLEQGDYKKAKDLLKDNFEAQKTSKPGAAETYQAVAGQVVKSARSKAERYRAYGLNVTDRTLPLEVLNDLEKMRETVEAVIEQSKENGGDRPKADAALALLEESTTVRSALARDDYDARRWTDEAADSREQIVVSRSVITNAVDGTTSPLSPNNRPIAVVGESTAAQIKVDPPASQVNRTDDSLAEKKTETKSPPAGSALSNAAEVAKAESKPEPTKPIIVQNAPREENLAAKKPKQSDPVPEKDAGPMQVGSLVSYATNRTNPIYPAVARTMRTSGVVRVEVMVNELGEVEEVQRTSGPSLLQDAAKDAVMKWRFKPFVRDGQPVRVTGFVSFNFSL